MGLKTPALTLYVVSMLLWFAPPAEAQPTPTIQGLSYSYIQANSYAVGTTVDVTVDSTIGGGFVCRWTSPALVQTTTSASLVSSTLMTCRLIVPDPGHFGAYMLEVSADGARTWSSPVPFTYDCEEGRFGPTCAGCTCLQPDVCDEGLSGTGTCTSCPSFNPVPRCGANCSSFCTAGCDPSGCEQATCGCFACDVGLTGDQCDTPCDTNCSDTGGCDQSTAVCIGCDPGWHGSSCDSMCSANCAGAGTCAQADGTCDFGCVEGFGGPDCETPATAVPAGGAGLRTLAALLLVAAGAIAIAARVR